MRRRGGELGAGGVVRAAQGGRGRPRTSDGARARAQENLRERSIDMVPGQEWRSGGRRPEGVDCGDWSRKGWAKAKAQGCLWGFGCASAANFACSRDKRSR
jgi:hypothetical protein